MGIKAIETVYNSYRFRSRLEARWAVFFDALGVEYDYEPEGYDLGAAGCYLPDFWLPKQSGFRGGYIEIKGVGPSESEQVKADVLAEASGEAVYVFAGPIEIPDDYSYPPIGNAASWYSEGHGFDHPYYWCECHMCGAVGIEFDGRGARLACGCSHEGHGNGDKCYRMDSPRLVNAFTLARQARFEHGESG